MVFGRDFFWVVSQFGAWMRGPGFRIGLFGNCHAANGVSPEVFPDQFVWIAVGQECATTYGPINRAVSAAQVSEGIESHVVDPASIATSRRRRRAKTDKIDGEALIRALLAYKRGEPRICAMVKAPTCREEDDRRICRERSVLTAERVAHVNRIKCLLFGQGISDCEPMHRCRRARLDELKTGDGRPLPPQLKAQVSRELDRLELLIQQIKAVEAERDALLASTESADKPAPTALLLGLKGIGPEFASVLWSEGLCRSSGKWRPMPGWRRRPGRAARSIASKVCRRPAIRGCGRR